MTEKLGVTEKEPAFGQKTLDWARIGDRLDPSHSTVV